MGNLSLSGSGLSIYPCFDGFYISHLQQLSTFFFLSVTGSFLVLHTRQGIYIIDSFLISFGDAALDESPGVLQPSIALCVSQ